MTQYYGICLIIVVSALVIGVLSRIVTRSILEEIDKVRATRMVRIAKVLEEALKGIVKTAKELDNIEVKKKDEVE